MLTYKPDMDRAFDVTVKRSIPFLIYLNTESRNRLAKLLQELATVYRSHNFDLFPSKVDEINNFIDGLPLDNILNMYIHEFNRIQSTLEEMYYRLDERVRTLEMEKQKVNEHNDGKIPVNDHYNEKQNAKERYIEKPKVKENGPKRVMKCLQKVSRPVTKEYLAAEANISTVSTGWAISELRKMYGKDAILSIPDPNRDPHKKGPAFLYQWVASTENNSDSENSL